MTTLLLVIFFALGVLGALLYVLWSRGWMRNGYFTIGTSILLAFGVFLIFQTAGSVLYIMATHGDLSGGDAKAVLGSTALAQLLILIGGTVLLIKATEQDLVTSLRLEGLRQTPPSLYALAIPVIYLAQYVGGIASIFWARMLEHLPLIDKLKALEDSQDAMINSVIRANSIGEFVFVLLGIAIVPAIAEEIFFRGFLQTNIERSGHRRSRPYTALVLASVIFAAVHFSPLKFPGLLALGLAMGYMSYRTNNLLVGSIAHAFNNGSIVLLMLLRPELMDAADPEAMMKANDLSDAALLGAFVLMSALLAAVLAMFHRASEPIEARHYAEQEVRATTAYFDAIALREMGAFTPQHQLGQQHISSDQENISSDQEQGL